MVRSEVFFAVSVMVAKSLNGSYDSGAVAVAGFITRVVSMAASSV